MEKLFWRAGQLAQGLALGVILFSAIVMILQIDSGARVFRYQGF
jgi:hypothetical protein